MSKLLFLSVSLLVLRLHADKIPGWTEVPLIPGKPVVTGLNNGQKKVLSKINDGSEVSRSIGELLGNEVWRHQDDITDALYKSIGDISVDFDFIDAGSGSVGVSFSPKRRIYFYNQPFVRSFQDGRSVITLDNDKASKFVLFNTLESRIKGDLSLIDDIGSISGADLKLKADVGLGLYYIQSTDSPRQLPPTTGDDNLLNISEEDKSALSVENLKGKGVFSKLGKAAVKLFDALESSIAKTADKISDEDSSDVFFSDLFDAVRLPVKVPFNDKAVISKMKVGEIATISLFGGGGPGVSIESGVLSTGVSGFVRVAYQISIKKLDNNKVLVRPKLALKRGWDFEPLEVKVGASLGKINLSYTPFLLRFEGANSYSLESLIEFDLNDPSSADAFNDAMSLSFKKAGNLIRSNSPNTVVSNRIYEKAKINKSDLSFNIGLARLSRERAREVTRTTSIDDNGNKKYSWLGNISASSYSRLKWFGKEFEIAKSTQSIMKSNLNNKGIVISDVRSVPGTTNQGNDESLSRVSTTTLYDKRATLADLNKMLEFARLSTGLTDSLIPAQILSQIESYYKTHKISEQSITILTKFDRNTIHTVLSLEPERFWKLLSNVLLVDPNQALATFGGRSLNMNTSKGREDLNTYRDRVTWNGNCKPTNAFNGGVTIPCKWLWISMNNLGSSFIQIRNAKSDEDRLRSLTKIESFLGITPLINNILAAGYKEATKTLSNPNGLEANISYYVRYNPDKASTIEPYSNPMPSDMQADAFKKRFNLGEINEITQSERRFKGGAVYLDNTGKQKGMFLSFETPILIGSDQIVTLWLQGHRVLRKDIPLATSQIANLVAQPPPRPLLPDSQESLNVYEVQIPDEMVAKMVEGKNELHVRIENSRGEPLSELGRFEIRRAEKK